VEGVSRIEFPLNALEVLIMSVIRCVRLAAVLFAVWAMTGQAQAQMVVVPGYGGWGGGYGLLATSYYSPYSGGYGYGYGYSPWYGGYGCW